MEWFGWLTKGQYEVSILDRLIFIGELVIVVFAIFAPLAWLEVRRKKKRLSR